METINIFLVNLDKRPDRLKYVSDQLKVLDLKFKRISAVDGSLLDDDHPLVDNNAFLVQMGKQVTKGEIGCAESHRLIWREIVDKSIPFALVIEDDVKIDRSVKSFLNSNVYENLDFINLSYTRPFNVNEKALSELRENNIQIRPLIFTKWRKTWEKLEGRMRRRIFKIFYLADNVTVCECDPAPILTSGYLISLKAASTFLEATHSMTFPVDYTWRNCTGELKQAFVANSIIIQALADSDIAGRTQDNHLTRAQKIKRFFFRNRRVKRKIDLIKMYGWKFF